jgi:CheY-like chemotaxis protein
MPSENFSPGLDVLVVDDDPLTRTLMTRLLTRLGCNVTTAENGAMALEMIVGEAVNTSPMSPIPASSPDLDSSVFGPISEEPEWSSGDMKYAVVFLDNQMPVLSGLKAVRKLRELNRRDFVVGVTGNALLTDQKEYLEAGADHVLTKPVLERSLRSMLAKADERRKQGKAPVVTQ